MSEIDIKITKGAIEHSVVDVMKDVLYDIVKEKLETSDVVDDIIREELKPIIKNCAQSKNVWEAVQKSIIEEMDDSYIEDETTKIIHAHIVDIVTKSIRGVNDN